MDLSKAKEYLHLVQAAVKGKTIQNFDNISNMWYDIFACRFDDPACEYRIKPEPTLRPWKPEEVPVGACYRGKGKVGNCAMILAVRPDGCICVPDCIEGAAPLTSEDMLSYCEFSIDHGKTWLPCGVVE